MHDSYLSTFSLTKNIGYINICLNFLMDVRFRRHAVIIIFYRFIMHGVIFKVYMVKCKFKRLER